MYITNNSRHNKHQIHDEHEIHNKHQMQIGIDNHSWWDHNMTAKTVLATYRKSAHHPVNSFY